MRFRALFLTVFLTLYPVLTASAQYSIQDDDVVLSNGIIQSCSYDFAIKNIIIPDTLDGQAVTGIADGRFLGIEGYEGVFASKGIQSVVFPSALTLIGEYAFIENSLDSVDFSRCWALISIGHSAFESNEIVNLDFSSCTALSTIGNAAFDHNPLSSVDLKECSSLTLVGDYAFRSTTLSNLNLSACTGLLTIGNYAFANGKLTSLDLKDCTVLSVIKSGAFSSNELASIELAGCDALETIENHAFFGNELNTVNLSVCQNLSSIGNYAFSANKLSNINFSASSKLKQIGDDAFRANELGGIDLSACTALEKIGTNAFGENQSLGGFVLPVNLEYSALGWKDNLGNTYAGGEMVSDFSNYYYIKAYTLTDDDVVVQDGIIISCSYDFENSDIAIPETLDGQTVIGIADQAYTHGVFSSRPIINVVLPSSIETIGDGAFHKCDLNRIDLSACNALRKIGESAFQGNALTQIDFFGCTALETIGAGAFGENAIADISFNSCVRLKTIGSGAFANNVLTEIDLSPCAALISIESFAFVNPSISSFALPINSEYADIGWKDTFGNIYSGGDTVSDMATLFYVPIAYTLTDADVEVVDGVIQSCKYDFKIKEIIIPESLDGQVVTGIGFRVFFSRGLLGISLPSTIETIGTWSFRLNDLTRVDFSSCSALTSIGSGAFSLNKLSSLDLSPCTSLISIEREAFYLNKILNIDFRACSTLRKIGYSAFKTNKLDRIDLSACIALISIERDAFLDNPSLEGFALPVNTEYRSLGWKDHINDFIGGSVTVKDLTTYYYVPIPYILTDEDVEIIDGVIQSCTYDFEFKDIVIPEILDGQSVIEIADKNSSGIFRNKGIRSVILPSSLEIIGDYEFSLNQISILDLSACSALRFIGSSAFHSNPLPNLDLGSCKALEVIGSSAFYKNNLTSLDLSSCTALISIGSSAFSSNSLTSLNLSACLNLVSIGSRAFASNYLSTIDLSNCKALVSIESFAFGNNDSLNAMTLPNNAEYGMYGWKDGRNNQYSGGDLVSDFEEGYYIPVPYTLVDDDVEVSNGIIQSCTYDPVFKIIIIPETLDGQIITGIDNADYGVFRGRGMTDVTLPSTLETIGARSFESNRLLSIDLSACPALTSIGRSAFSYNALGSIDLSDCKSLTYIGQDAFRYNDLDSGFNVPININYQEHAWRDSWGNSYTGGDVVLDLSVFYYLPIPYTLTDNDVVVTDGIIQSCSADLELLNVRIPEILDGQAITGIGKKNQNINVFENKGMAGVTLPSTLTFIGAASFSYNRFLSIDLSACPALCSIGAHAFYYNDLTTVDMDSCKALIIVGENAFHRNHSLSGFALPSNTEFDSLGWRDGYGNIYSGGDTVSDFSTKYNIPVPYTLTDEDVEVVDGIIQSCSYDFELKDIVIPELLDGQIVRGIADGSYSGGLFWKKDIQSLELPSTIQSIGSSAFSSNALTSIDFSHCIALTKIGRSAFSHNQLIELDLSACTALTSIEYNSFSNNKLSAVDLPSSLQIIGANSFAGNKVIDIDLSACSELISIGINAFSGNDPLLSITLPIHTEYSLLGWNDRDDNVYSGGDTVNDFETYYFVPAPYTLTDDDVIVTDGIIRYCSHNFLQKDIIIPDTLDGQAVLGIADGEETKYGPSGVFADIPIKNLELPSTLKYIGYSAFSNCNMVNVDYSKCTALSIISEHSFSSNELSDITLPSNLEIIMPYAFYSNRLDSIDLSTNAALTYIGESVFQGNDSLDSIILPINTEYLPYGWKDLAGNMFTGGSQVVNLTTFYYIPAPYTLTDEDVEITDGVISSCSYGFGLKVIIIPDTLAGQAVRGIADAQAGGVFEAKDMVSISLPSTLETLGSRSFYYNDLKSVDLSACSLLVHIGSSAFSFNRLTSIDLSACTALTFIGRDAFGYNELTGYNLPTPDLAGYVFSYWEDSNGSVYEGGELVSNMNRNLTAILTPIYRLIITVTDGAGPIGGAEVTLAGYGSVMTDSAGHALFNGIVAEEDIPYSVSATGFEDVSGTISVVDADVNELIILRKITGISNALETHLRIYPNPSHKIVSIETDLIGQLSIEITSLNGELLLRERVKGSTHKVDLSSFREGVYFITIRSKDFVTSRKIIKY